MPQTVSITKGARSSGNTHSRRSGARSRSCRWSISMNRLPFFPVCVLFLPKGTKSDRLPGKPACCKAAGRDRGLNLFSPRHGKHKLPITARPLASRAAQTAIAAKTPARTSPQSWRGPSQSRMADCRIQGGGRFRASRFQPRRPISSRIFRWAPGAIRQRRPTGRPPAGPAR